MAKTKQKTKQKGHFKQLSPRKTSKSKGKKYKLTNWAEYNQALVDRGRIDVWVEEAVLENWYAKPSGKKGAQPTYADLAIRLVLQLGKVFRQRLRQTEGLVKSTFKLMGLELKVPNYSTLSRRGAKLKVKLPRTDRPDEKITMIIDSSGLKVFGEGEWKVRQHGYSKRRTWRKIHLSITPDGEIREAPLTANSVSDDEAAVQVIKREKADIEAFLGDGAYDKRKVYEACQRKGIDQIIIPPRQDAKLWRHGNSKAPPHPRDANLRAIRRSSLKSWKETVGYHTRSLVETAVYRYKTIFGGGLEARNLPQQQTEALIKTSILNQMLKLGMPATVFVE